MSYCYDYPRPAVTVDCLILSRLDERWHLLLIRRGKPPFDGAWALPGGFVDMEESLDEAVARELEEETGLRGVELHQFGAFGAVDRDPRGRTITVAYRGILPGEKAEFVRGGDDAAEARWFPVGGLPSLAFDHDEVIRKGLVSVRW